MQDIFLTKRIAREAVNEVEFGSIDTSFKRQRREDRLVLTISNIMDLDIRFIDHPETADDYIHMPVKTMLEIIERCKKMGSNERTM